MDAKKNTLYPLIILFFLIGLVVGYVIHKPATTTEYINRTIEVQATPTIKEVEKIVYVTAIPTSTETAAALVADFNVSIYDQTRDKPSRTIELTNWRVNPDTLSIPPGESVLIIITDDSLQDPLKLILGSYEKNLGTSGAVVVTFNKKGTYNLKAVIPSADPNINPRIYGVGTISVN